MGVHLQEMDFFSKNVKIFTKKRKKIDFFFKNINKIVFFFIICTGNHSFVLKNQLFQNSFSRVKWNKKVSNFGILTKNDGYEHRIFIFQDIKKTISRGDFEKNEFFSQKRYAGVFFKKIDFFSFFREKKCRMWDVFSSSGNSNKLHIWTIFI